MQSQKLDLSNVNTNALLARLLTAKRFYDTKHSEAIEGGRAMFDEICTQIFEDNFICEDSQKQGAIINLQLFFLGKENKFSKALGLC